MWNWANRLNASRKISGCYMQRCDAFTINIWKVYAKQFVYSFRETLSRTVTHAHSDTAAVCSCNIQCHTHQTQSRTFKYEFSKPMNLLRSRVSLNTIQWISSLVLFQRSRAEFYNNSIYILNAIHSEKQFQILMRQSKREFISLRIFKYLVWDAVSRHLFAHSISWRA